MRLRSRAGPRQGEEADAERLHEADRRQRARKREEGAGQRKIDSGEARHELKPEQQRLEREPLAREAVQRGKARDAEHHIHRGDQHIERDAHRRRARGWHSVGQVAHAVDRDGNAHGAQHQQKPRRQGCCRIADHKARCGMGKQDAGERPAGREYARGGRDGEHRCQGRASERDRAAPSRVARQSQGGRDRDRVHEQRRWNQPVATEHAHLNFSTRRRAPGSGRERSRSRDRHGDCPPAESSNDRRPAARSR